MKHGTMCPVCGGMMSHSHPMMCGCGKKGEGLKMMAMKMPKKLLIYSDELGLSEEQIAAIRKKHAELKKQLITIGSQKKLAMIDLKEAAMGEQIDMLVVEAKAREIGKLKGDKILALIQGIQAIKETLAPEQRKRLKEMFKSWMKKGEGRMEEEAGEEEEPGEEPEE